MQFYAIPFLVNNNSFLLLVKSVLAPFFGPRLVFKPTMCSFMYILRFQAQLGHGRGMVIYLDGPLLD